jgi:predicted nucleic acid-binding protein
MILSPENEFAVLLDACVLVPMPLCDTLLRLAEEPALYRPLWSELLLTEVGDAIETRLHNTPAQRERRIRLMREHFPEALVEVPLDLIKAFDCIPDPDDRHVLAAAVRGHANALVTLNTKHFPEDCLAKYDLIRQSPDEFLVNQFHLSQDIVLEKIDAQAAAMKKDRVYVANLLRERGQAPEFAELIFQRS